MVREAHGALDVLGTTRSRPDTRRAAPQPAGASRFLGWTWPHQLLGGVLASCSTWVGAISRPARLRIESYANESVLRCPLAAALVVTAALWLAALARSATLRPDVEPDVRTSPSSSSPRAAEAPGALLRRRAHWSRWYKRDHLAADESPSRYASGWTQQQWNRGRPCESTPRTRPSVSPTEEPDPVRSASLSLTTTSSSATRPPELGSCSSGSSTSSISSAPRRPPRSRGLRRQRLELGGGSSLHSK